MTSYWDDWQQIISNLFEEEGTREIYKMALEQLISRLHDYDHEHGGHVIDNYCGLGRLNLYKQFLLCATKYGGHDWHASSKKKGLVKCFNCEFEAHPKYLKGIGIDVSEVLGDE